MGARGGGYSSQSCSRFGQAVQLCLAILLATLPAQAHIGSPDIFAQVQAGPYPLLLALHPPAVYPGAMELDLRVQSAVQLTAATAALDDGKPVEVHLFRDGTAIASLWVPTAESHTIHLSVQGSAGAGTLTFTVPAPPNAAPAALRLNTLPPALYVLIGLVALGVLLTIVYRGRRLGLFRAGLLMTATALIALSVLLYVRPQHRTTLAATLTPDGQLNLTLSNPGESLNDLAYDHGRLVHLFLVREPRKDVFVHVHPQMTGQASAHQAEFTVSLPAMPPGVYTAFADFYHADGRNETAVLSLTLPAQFHPPAPNPDDTSTTLPPLVSTKPTPSEGHAEPPAPSQLATPQPAAVSAKDQVIRTAHLPDGYSIELRTPARLLPLHANVLQVTLLDREGQPPADMALFLGMTAHVVVLRSDNSVFAHIHPGSTLPMLTSAQGPMATQAGAVPPPMPDMPGMPGMAAPSLANTADLPYGFPSAGVYRLFVQMKHGTVVETTAFDLPVTER